METETVQIDLGIGECLADLVSRECLGAAGVRVGFETALDEFTFGGFEE